ncbi:hypothetical protein EUTSA_v10011088mg [Eutrema salsugineum]|uniref:GPI-anchored protein LLG1-like domain-containing protein n=1 Tax=Eutrema salsugineum TaxID=72664 RepID=V4LTF5_EUTSA|nr:hypothetical protein EUTSA_v10011088mg [Eutrema salsugineum]
MELKLLFLLMTSLVTLSSSSSISDSVLESQTSVTERSVLHTKKKCEVNFEYMNYTAMTKRCKGPAFPAKECCLAFKEFACPYANQINDMNSDCAKTMFSYMNIYGNYPTGLFANDSLSLNASTADSTAPRLITLLISATTTVLAFLALA